MRSAYGSIKLSNVWNAASAARAIALGGVSMFAPERRSSRNNWSRVLCRAGCCANGANGPPVRCVASRTALCSSTGRERLQRLDFQAEDLLGEVAQQHRAHVHVAATRSQRPAHLATRVVVRDDQRDGRKRIGAFQLAHGALDPRVRHAARTDEFDAIGVRGGHRGEASMRVVARQLGCHGAPPSASSIGDSA